MHFLLILLSSFELNTETCYKFFMEKKSITINKIYWDRIWIYMDITTDVHMPLYLTRIKAADKTPYSCELEVVSAEGDHYLLRVNVTNPETNAQLPRGEYAISNLSLKREAHYYPNIILSEDLSENLSACDKHFPYHIKKVYSVYFRRDARFGMKLVVRNTIGKLTEEEAALERKKAVKRRMAQDLYNTAREAVLSGRHLSPTREKCILLMSDQKSEPTGNLLAIKKELIKEGYTFREMYRSVLTEHFNKKQWLEAIRVLAWADYIFLDDHSPTLDWLTLKKTTIVQLWHAGAGFKSTGYSRFGMPASPGPKSGHRQYTFGIAGSIKIRHFFAEVWGINPEMVLPTGMPRLDSFLDPDEQAKTRADLILTYPYLMKRSNILFAPTYRGRNKADAHYPMDKLDFGRIYKMCLDKDANFIIKNHPFVTEPVSIPEEYKDRIFDMTSYENINDLFLVTDLLITDYSSSIYEFSLMDKPMLFYAFDRDEYCSERGFHRDYESNVPGRIVTTFDELIDAIYKEDYDFEKVAEYVDKNFDRVDCHASERVIKAILG